MLGWDMLLLPRSAVSHPLKAQTTLLARHTSADVLFVAFGFLSPKDLASCSRTCKLWNDIAQDKRLWRRINKRWHCQPSDEATARQDPIAYFRKRIAHDRLVERLMTLYQSSSTPVNLDLLRSPELALNYGAEYLGYQLASPSTPWSTKHTAAMFLRRMRIQWILDRWQTFDALMPLELGACLIASMHFLHLDPQTQIIDPVFKELDRLAAGFVSPPPDVGARKRLEAFIDYIFTDLGFRGDQHLQSVDSSYINTVLEHRMGLPIALAMVIRALGARQSPPIEIDMVGFPHHFLARHVCPDTGETLYIDPLYTDPKISTQSLVMTGNESERLLQALNTAFLPQYLNVVSHTQVFLRMLRNIYHVAAHIMQFTRNMSTMGILYSITVLHLRLEVNVSNWQMRRMRLDMLDSCEYYSDIVDADKESNMLLNAREPRHFTLSEYGEYYEALQALKDRYCKPVTKVQTRTQPVESSDSSSPTVTATAVNIKHKIGTLFRHRQQGYIAVIQAWDPQCDMPLGWQQANNVKSLERGANQPFYSSRIVNSTQNTSRYVAEDNIVPIVADDASDHWLTMMEQLHLLPSTDRPVPGWLETIAGMQDIPSDKSQWSLSDIKPQEFVAELPIILGQSFDGVDTVNRRLAPNQFVKRQYPDD
ncbi:hypothetical protein RI367_005207 [Sorochytrium milnesiophthora]